MGAAKETELPHAFQPMAGTAKTEPQGKSCRPQHVLDACGKVWGAPAPAVGLGQAKGREDAAAFL